MNIVKLPLDFFVDKLNNGEPFSFVRMGDGEFNAILGVAGHNCDGHEYFPDLGIALRQTLEEPRDYLYAIGPKITARKNELTRRTMDYLDRHAKVKRWHDSEVFLNASLACTLKPFVDAFAGHRVMLVGASHLHSLPTQVESFIEVPAVNAWLRHDEIYREIMREAHACDVILFSSGMLSKVLIWELFPHVGKTHIQLDIGSTFDLYCGKMSRSYARKLSAAEIERLREVNFGSKEND